MSDSLLHKILTTSNSECASRGVICAYKSDILAVQADGMGVETKIDNNG